MNLLKKLKSGNFWVSIISAGVLVAESVFGFEIKTEYLNQILLGLMGVLTMFGIISDHGEQSITLKKTSQEQTDNPKTENVENFSNIKSICDTISLMLNKISINPTEKENDSKKEENLNHENVKVENEILNENEILKSVLEKENVNNFFAEIIKNNNKDTSFATDNLKEYETDFNAENMANFECQIDIENSENSLKNELKEIQNCPISSNDVKESCQISSDDIKADCEDFTSTNLEKVNEDCNISLTENLKDCEISSDDLEQDCDISNEDLKDVKVEDKFSTEIKDESKETTFSIVNN